MISVPDFDPPGRGRTVERLLFLARAARRHDVSAARLAEAHLDAVAILREAGREPLEGSRYGVWASASPDGVEPALRPRATAEGWTLAGTKRFCSGLGIVDRALVTVDAGSDLSLLVELDVRASATVEHRTEGWATVALRDTCTGEVVFDGHPVRPDQVVAPAAWYLGRPGFWHGACGPAACWAGAALGLVDAAERLVDDDPHRRAHLGALRTEAWVLHTLLREVGREIDRFPHGAEDARRRALALRAAVDRGGTAIAEEFSQMLGPRPFTTDPETAQRFADLHLYLRQGHGRRDLETLGRLR